MNERRMFHAGALLLLAALFSGASAVSVADHDLPDAQRWHDDQLRERQQRELERRDAFEQLLPRR